MGGIAQVAGGALRKAGEHLGGWLRTSEIGSMVQDTLRSQKSEFMRGTPEGTQLWGMMEKYTQLKDQYLKAAMQPHVAVAKAIVNDADLTRKPLKDIHASLKNSGHAASLASGQLMADPKNADKDMFSLLGKARKEAALTAKVQVFGAGNENLAKVIMPLYDNPDPAMHSHANAMLDILANQFHDTVTRNGAPASETKLTIRSLLELENKTRNATGEKPLAFEPSDLKTGAIYQGTNQLEQLLSRRTRLFLAPLIAIPHISTFFNYSWAPLTAMAKSMSDFSNEEVKQLVEASGIFNSLLHHSLDEELRSSSGMIGRTLGSGYGRLAGKLFHNPGFSQLRKMQLHVGGILGYHSTIYWAEQAARGDKRAMLELKDLGLDVPEIIKRGGELSPQEKIQGIYHFTNNRIFISKALDRSLTSTRNPWTRMLTMFHGYVTSQQVFVRHELNKMLEAGDYAGLARVAGTFGLVFPAIAPVIKSLEVLGRTASLHQASNSIQQDYQTLQHPQGATDFAKEYIELLSFFGTWGTLHSFFQAANSDRLAIMLMGPIAGSAVRSSQDAINFAFNPSKSGHHNIRPLAKDVLQQTVPIAGNILSHRLFPTRKEQEE